MPEPPAKWPRSNRTDAVSDPLSDLDWAQLRTFSPAQLRVRALRLLDMTDEFPALERPLLGLAATLNNRANALERTAPSRVRIPLLLR